jgi:hypothetical protein
MERKVETYTMMPRAGICTVIAWCLLLGPVGVLSLVGIAFAMLTQNLALGLVSGTLIACPFLLGVAWAIVCGLFLLSSAVDTERAVRKPIVDETAGVSTPSPCESAGFADML